MNFIKQVKAEVVNLCKMKFILIIGIIIFVIGFIGPIINHVAGKYFENNSVFGGYTTSYYGESDEDLVVNGVTISSDNPMWWEVHYYSEEYDMYIGDFYNEEQMVYIDDIASQYLEFFLKYAQVITTYEDYRLNLVYQVNSIIAETYVLEANPTVTSEFVDAVNYITYVDDIEGLLNLSDEEKETLIAENTELLETLDRAIMEDDFNAYVECMIVMLNQEIESYEAQIAIQEAAIIATPDLEESANEEIERLNLQIATIKDTTIPTWEYRLDNQVLPNSDDWRNTALSDIEYATYRLSDSENVMKEEEFLNGSWEMQQYKNYEEYVASKEKQKVEAQEDILIAQNSLAANEPDMKFVSDGARNQVNSNLVYAITVSVLGILIGGYLIATEFQSGTIRLLMIRPRTRAKVYATKYLAGLTYILGIYIVGMIMNILVNGIISGFADYGYPNYTASGTVNFWGLILVRIIVCAVTIIFSYTLSYAFSALIRNAAIAIALPSAAFFGGMLVPSILAYTKYSKFLAYTPLPYLNFAGFYSEYGAVQTLLEKGVAISVPVGIIMLLVLSVICYVLGYYSFKKHDITN